MPPPCACRSRGGRGGRLPCWAVACGAAIYLTLADPSPAFVPSVTVALYTVAAHGERRRTLAVAAAMVPSVAAVVVLFSPDDGGLLRQLLDLVAQLGFALAVGEAVRSQGVHVGREEPERAVEALQAIKQVSTGALDDLRYALGALRDDSTDAPTGPTPSMRDLPELVGKARSSGLSVVLRMEGSLAALPVALQVAVYRIVQEGLTNVMRHASGAQATVRIAVANQQVQVDVINDGAGKPTASSGAGTQSGLIGMRERASAVGGAFEAGPATGGGFGVRAVLPLDERPA